MNPETNAEQAALDYTLKYNPPMDHAAAERNLKQLKSILDGLGVVFMLGSGSCLGAVRDGAFIPWDDDIDLLTVLDINGMTEQTMDSVVEAFQEGGFHVMRQDGLDSTVLMTMKDSVRISLECLRTRGEHLFSYPGITFPSVMFTQPAQIDFLGEKFNVPNPPREYLATKYGPQWMTPRRSGEYEHDVVVKIPGAELEGSPCWVRVLDESENPVAGAEVTLVGGATSSTDAQGYAEVTIPGTYWFALMIRYPGHEEVLYMEELEPGGRFVYRAGSMASARSSAGGETGTIGNLLTREE